MQADGEHGAKEKHFKVAAEGEAQNHHGGGHAVADAVDPVYPEGEHGARNQEGNEPPGSENPVAGQGQRSHVYRGTGQEIIVHIAVLRPRMQNDGKQPFPLHARQLGFPVARLSLLKRLEFRGVIDGISKLCADGTRAHVHDQGDDE